VAVLRPVPEAGAQWLSVAVPGLRGAQAAGPAAPYLSLVRGWDELLSAGPPQLRHTRRRVRRFEREGGTIARLPGPDAAREFGQLVEIEARSWKTPAGVSWSGSAAIRAVLQAALETVGGAEVWLARVGSRPVGYLMNFVAADRSLFYQGAYDPDYRTLYPGGVLHYSAIQAACAAGRREYDFLNGAEEYKGGWTSGTRQTRYLSLNPVSARGRAAFAALVTPTWFLRRFAVAHSFRSVTRRWVAQHDGRRP
jgi:CelD/BcsL family acetyltransferase involved in cellulose biosynthesis